MLLYPIYLSETYDSGTQITTSKTYVRKVWSIITYNYPRESTKQLIPVQKKHYYQYKTKGYKFGMDLNLDLD